MHMCVCIPLCVSVCVCLSVVTGLLGELALGGRLACRTFAEAFQKEEKEARLGIVKAGLQCRLKGGLS